MRLQSLATFGLAFLARPVASALFGSGTTLGVLAFLCRGLTLMGLTYGPLGTALAELFPTRARY